MSGLCRTEGRYACFLEEPAPSQRLLDEAKKLRNDVAAAEAIDAFAAAGIPSILLKGPAIDRWLYSGTFDRTYGDVDLLIAPRDFQRAQPLLEQLGFVRLNLETTRVGQESHHDVWHRDLDGILLELHRSIQGASVPDDVLWDTLESETEPLALGIGSTEAAVLKPAGRAMIVALHAAQHGALGPRRSDLERALEQVSLPTWREAAELSSRLAAGDYFSFGLSLVPEGRHLAAELGLSGREPIGPLLAAAAAPRTSMGWEHLAQTSGLRRRVAFLARELVPTVDVLRNIDPLARRGVLGLMGAYARRPVVLARAAPAGFRAWRQAVARAEEGQRDE
jgi:Uncharacterised nucleotidyltransferase